MNVVSSYVFKLYVWRVINIYVLSKGFVIENSSAPVIRKVT
jgi:hypothetical protein